MSAAIPVAGHASAHAENDESKVRLGMLFYVFTDVILVAFLFAAYIWLRAYNTDNGWFPAKYPLPNSTTTDILVGLIVVSAVCFYVAYRGIRSGNQTVLKVGMVFALLLLIAALIGQIRFMGQQGFAATDGSFASTYVFVSGYHVYHMLVGLFLGLGVTIRSLRGKYSAEHHLGLVTIGYFWYWMALMPVLFTLIMTVLPPNTR
jgi:heme/copper-type cytochrome/quinol oxidase subunit 3